MDKARHIINQLEEFTNPVVKEFMDEKHHNYFDKLHKMILDLKEELEKDSQCVKLPISKFNYLMIESFRYALPRDKTIASIDCANNVKIYWKYIQDDSKRQIRRDVKNALDNNLITDQNTINVWELVLKLND